MARQFNTICISGFVDDVMFTHNRPGKGDAKWGAYSKATRQRGSTGAQSDA